MTSRGVPPRSRSLVMAAGLAWIAVLVGRSAGLVMVGAGAMAALSVALWSRSPVVLVAIPSMVIAWSSMGESALPTVDGGSGVHAVELSRDPIDGPFGALAFAEIEPAGIPVALRLVEASDLQAGDRVVVRARSDGTHATIRGRQVAATLEVRSIESRSRPSNPLLRSANLMRRRILTTLDVERSQGRALLAGFLIGDVGAVDPIVLDDLRRAGLSHLVAVSGSNVALFLGLWWVVTAPLSVSPRWRAVVGVVGLVIFGHLTRWEASVVRASAMAAIVLVARTIGWVIDGWAALSIAVIGSLWLAPALATSVGFQLSVAATVGIMCVPGTPGGFTARAMLMTAAAQLAVTPIILAVFGSVPLFSPLSNLIAIPVVGAATIIGGIGALVGSEGLVGVASIGAGIVIAVGRVAAELPQVGWLATLAVLVLGRLVVRRPGTKPLVSLVAAGVLAFAVFPVGPTVDVPAVVFLDVGQGDAALVLDRGFTMMIDGGPDPRLLDRKLRQYGVDRIDVLVASHVHADHVDGLSAIFGRRTVGELWEAFDPHQTSGSERLRSLADRFGVRRVRPEPGTSLRTDGMVITVGGPLRRYASPNDQSIVLIVDVAGTRFLFPGDVETFAQADLDVPDVDVLKVPHQGAATSDPSWLGRHAGSVAVVSVGPNDFGHPAEWVVDVLDAAGAEVLRTDRSGDVLVTPGPRVRVASRHRSRSPPPPGRRADPRSLGS